MGVGELGWEGMGELGKLINEPRRVWEKSGDDGEEVCAVNRAG